MTMLAPRYCLIPTILIFCFLHGAHAQATNGLAGRWLVTLKETDGVELNFAMTVESDNEKKWEAFSREGAVKEIIGGGASMLGGLFGKLPPHGALIAITDGTAETKDGIQKLIGKVTSPFLGYRDLSGTFDGTTIHAELKSTDSAVIRGTLDFRRAGDSRPLRDYSKIAAEVERAIRNIIYDPRLAEREEFVKFFGELKRRFAAAADDLDAIGAFQALKPSLKTSHIDFIRNPTIASKSRDEIIRGNLSIDPASTVRLSYPAPQIAVLRINKWERNTSYIDKAFQMIAGTRAAYLIIDIRGNPGGDASSMAPLAHLVRQPTDVGAFLGRSWYESHAGPPTKDEIGQLKTVSTDATSAELFEQITSAGGVLARAIPREPYFGGSVILLVDKGTASASEPLAWGLKANRLASLIGEKTSGAMLTALPHAVGEGWIVTVPEADFVAADGSRLEGVGVMPDLKADSNNAYIATADRLISALPFSAEVLRGESYESLKRPDDAEKAYRSALKKIEEQKPRPDVASEAFAHKRLAGILSARGDAAAAIKEYREVLRLTPNDAEAQRAVNNSL